MSSLLLIGIIQLVAATISATIFLFVIFKLLKSVNKQLEVLTELKSGNLSIAVVFSAKLFAVMYIVRNASGTAYDLFALAFRDPDLSLFSFAKSAGIMVSHYLAAGILAVFSVYCGTTLFTFLTKNIDERHELQNDNLAIAIVLAVVILSIALFLSPGIQTILEALIPYPPFHGIS